jgi:hypothetical protein
MDVDALQVEMSSLMNWLRTEGGHVHESLVISSDAYGGHCIRVGNELAANAMLIRVPRPLMIELDQASAGLEALAPTMRLAIRLLEEKIKGPGSRWSLYLSFLPSLSQLAFLPIVHHFQEVGSEAFIKGDTPSIATRLSSASPSLSRAFEAQRLDIIRDFHHLPANLCELKDWLWATSIVRSRALHLWSGPTLVPLFDFLNHNFPPNVCCQCQDTASSKSIYSPPSTPDSSLDSGDSEIELEHSSGFLSVESVREVEEGSELLWVYSSHSSDALWLLSYGFIPQESLPHPEDKSDGIDRVLDWARDLPDSHSIPGILELLKRERSARQ